MKQISSGLVFLHRQNPPVIYGGINPESLYIKSALGGSVCCCLEVPDYQECKILDEHRRHSISSALLHGEEFWGECYFLAPDIRNNLVSAHAFEEDVFSLGLIFILILRQYIDEYQRIALYGKYISDICI